MLVQEVEIRIQLYQYQCYAYQVKQETPIKVCFDRAVIAYCKSYKYLGANIDEFLDYNFTAAAQADSAGRALSCSITKMINGGSLIICTVCSMMLATMLN